MTGSVRIKLEKCIFEGDYSFNLSRVRKIFLSISTKEYFYQNELISINNKIHFNRCNPSKSTFGPSKNSLGFWEEYFCQNILYPIATSVTVTDGPIVCQNNWSQLGIFSVVCFRGWEFFLCKTILIRRVHDAVSQVECNKIQFPLQIPHLIEDTKKFLSLKYFQLITSQGSQ